MTAAAATPPEAAPAPEPRLHYPYPVLPLSAAQIEFVDERLQHRFTGLFSPEESEQARNYCSRYIKNTSDPSTTTNALAVAVDYLVLFYVMNDFARATDRGIGGWAEALRLLDHALLKGDTHVDDRQRPIAQTASRLKQVLAERPRSNPALDTDFITEVSLMIRAFLWEQEVLQHRLVPLQDFLEKRSRTISVCPWLALWRAVGDFDLPPTGEWAQSCRALERLSIEATYLANDVGSWPRDRKKGSRTLVTLWMHEHGCFESEALDDITRWHNRTVTELVAAADRLTSESETAAQRRYITLVCNVSRGCYETMCELEDRYRVGDG